MRKFFLLLLFVILCGQYLVYGQRGFDSLPESSIHIKFGDPIVFTPVEGAESYRFLFSLYGHVDTIQTTTPYISASEYTGMPLFETYDITMQYYKNSVWHVSEESNRVMIVTESGTDHMIHDMIKAGHMPHIPRENPDFDINSASIINIPVVYHVVVPTWFEGEPTDYVSPAQINQSMRILNDVFAGRTGELAYDTKIRFRPALTNPINYCGQNYYGITYNVYNGDNINIDNSVTHPGNIYYPSTSYDQPITEYYQYFHQNECINVWVFDDIVYGGMDEVYGICSSPCLNSGALPILAIIKDVVGENANMSTRQLGYTVAHEMGHYFGLLHAFIEYVMTPTIIDGQVVIAPVEIHDGIEDTPDYPGPFYGCDYSALDRIAYDNIMSYSPDGCRYRFTKDQAIRMRENIDEIFSNYSNPGASVDLLTDLLDIRIVSPGSNYICGNNDFDIKISTPDISIFQRLEITREDNSVVLTFNSSDFVQEDDNYVKHVHLTLPLTTGVYNFTAFTGGNGCTSISKQYEVVECNNGLDYTQAQWYFDSYVTLDFRSGIAQPGEFSAMDADCSESGICDESGNILFYTDGNRIWNGNHERLESELNLPIRYRGTIILKFDETHCAVVSLCENGQLVSRLIEHGQSFNISTYIYEEPYLLNGLTAVPCPTGGFWLVSTTESNIVSIKLRYNGTSLVYENGSEWNLNSQRNVILPPITLKASPNGKYIAYASDNCLKLAYFNATHGTFKSIDCGIYFTTKRSSPAFSPNGRFLYLAYQDLEIDGKLKITQYDLNNDYSCNCEEIRGNDVFTADNSGEYFRTNLYLQEGPDGRIYFSRVGDFFGDSRRIGVIMEPDNLASTFNGYEDCHVIEDLIDYEPGSILRNWDNLPNLVDAKDIDTCAASFTICSSDCSLESLTLHNFSLSPSLTWSFYDLSGNLITTDTAVEPELSSITELYNRNAFIIKQTTACEDHYMIDTVSFDAQMQIVGPDSICINGSSYIYSVSLEPHNQINSCEWTINSELNGDYYYDENLRYSDLMIRPEALDCEFTISCNIMDKYGCRDSAEFEVVANPDCSFVANVILECNSGKIHLTNNACNVDMSNYSASIIINGEPQPMELSGDIFVYSFTNSNEEHNATIIVTENTTGNITEIEVLIPRTIPSIYVEGVVSPALCADDICYVSVIVSGGELSNINNVYVDDDNSNDEYIKHIYSMTSLTRPNGDRVYYVAIINNDPEISDFAFDCVAFINFGGESCDTIKPIRLPYQRRKPTFITSHSDICHEGGSGMIAIEMELPRIDNYPYMSTIWNFGNNEVETYFVPSHGSTYTTILDNNNAQGINISQGTYTPTIQYSQICYETLTPIYIDVLSPEVQFEIHDSHTDMCSDGTTASIMIEISSGVEEGFEPYAIWNGGTDRAFFELSPVSNTYITTLNVTNTGVYDVMVFYTDSCAETLEANIQRMDAPEFIVSHTDICNVDETASITIEILSGVEEGYIPSAVWNGTETSEFVLSTETNTYITTHTAGRGLHSAEVQYSSYCSTTLPPVFIDVSSLEVNYDYVSDDIVGIHLDFDPPLSGYTISVTENGVTTETAITQNPYYFVTNINNYVEITTLCGTIPLNYRVSDVFVDLKSEACLESGIDISFEISGGTAPYTATFTCGDITVTQSFNTSGPNIIHTEITQGVSNHLTIVSADGQTYNINLGIIDQISNYNILTSPDQNSYIGETFVVPAALTFDHDVTFTNCTIYCAYTDYDDITSTQWTVNNGRTVTFDHCTIMSGCPDKMWQGIKVIGERVTHIDPPFPPAPIDPTDERTRGLGRIGKVICQNGTTIEDAIKAIESTNGGKIIANESSFYNNQYDLYYNSYFITQGSASAPTINNCTFSTTRLLNDNSIFPTAHIWMQGVSGVYIGGCTFENTIPHSADTVPEIGTPYYTDQRGIGIRANTSHFELYSACSFDKLFYGVHANGFKSNAIVVKNSTFTDNHRAIIVSANDGCKIKNNNITANSGIVVMRRPEFLVDYNVYIGTCHTFTYESNTITDATTGLYVYNSGTLGNQIRYNTFEGQPETGIPPSQVQLRPQYNAIVVVGENSSYRSDGLGSRGLEILCNTFRRNTRDIFVKDGYMRQQQGSSSAPTGNSFYYDSPNTFNRSHYQFHTQFDLATNNSYDVYGYEYYQHNAQNDTYEVTYQLKRNHHSTRVSPDNNSDLPYDESYCQCNDGNGPVVNPNPFNPIPFPGVDRTKSHIQQLGITLDSAINEYETKLDGGNTANALMKVSSISQGTAPSIEDLPRDGYLSDTVCNALVAKVEENPVYVTSVFVENSPLPTTTYEDVQDAEISQILKTVLSYYQSGENKRVADEKAIGDIKQEISLNENLLYDKALNDSLTATDYNIILGYFTEKTDIDSKIMACNILTSSENYDGARQQISSIRSLGTTEAINCADVMDMYINTMDTTMTKEMLKAHKSQLENLIADDNYLYSGIATALYEYAFDTLVPEYTPIYEEVITSKSTKADAIPEFSPYAIYPNPTSDFINIELASNVLDDDIIEFLKHYGINNIEDCETIQINIFDVNSRLVSTGKYKYDTLISIDVKNYPSGTYLVEIKGCYDNVMQTKIVKL